ncbi:MAG: class I SAM-dependent methyltransferase [Terriglobia bacterium]
MNAQVETAGISAVVVLHRACPACGNSCGESCKRVYAVPEFEVLRCQECGLTFINRVVQDNLGFGVEFQVSVDAFLAYKAERDFRRLKSGLETAGVTNFQRFRLLDVGCGIGTFLCGPQREGWEVAGLELSPRVADYAREARKLRVYTGSIEIPTKLGTEGFDVITMFGVIEHLANPAAAIKECARLLRPGGFLVLQTPTEDALIRWLGRCLFKATRGLVQFQVKHFYFMGGGHSICFNRRSIRTLLNRWGFDVLRIEQSTYGLRILLKRFEDLSLLERLLKSTGTAAVFLLGRIVGASNHMTVYARKRVAPWIP